jgi:hypothetical protein
MKTLIAALALAMVTSPAVAKKPRQHADRQVSAGCVDNWPRRSLSEIFFSFGQEPRANGCAPAVHDHGQFIGQDPDPNVRLQLLRNSVYEGYHLN